MNSKIAKKKDRLHDLRVGTHPKPAAPQPHRSTLQKPGPSTSKKAKLAPPTPPSPASSRSVSPPRGDGKWVWIEAKTAGMEGSSVFEPGSARSRSLSPPRASPPPRSPQSPSDPKAGIGGGVRSIRSIRNTMAIRFLTDSVFDPTVVDEMLHLLPVEAMETAVLSLDRTTTPRNLVQAKILEYQRRALAVGKPGMNVNYDRWPF